MSRLWVPLLLGGLTLACAQCPLPEPGQRTECGGIPVWGGEPNGADMGAWCRDSNCTSLEPGSWSCFAVAAPWNDSSWRFLAVFVNRTSDAENGDPDLFGLFTNGSAVPTTSAKGYSFQDTSSASHPAILKTISKADVGPDHDYTGALLCVRAYGTEPVTFALHAQLTPCSGSFDVATGTPLICQTPADAPEAERRFSGCSATGECECSGAYAKPVADVFAGIGFEDCSTPTLNISREELTANKSVELQHQRVEPDKWLQYRFHVDAEDGEVVVAVALEGNSSRGGTDLFLKSEQPAGWGPRQYDVRPRWNAATGDRTIEAVLSPSLSQWRSGVWFAGVVGSDAPVDFTLTIAKYECPGNCSSHGSCQPTGVEPPFKECQCDEGWGGRDCSKALRTLAFGEAVQEPPLRFEYAFFALPAPTEAMLSGSVELVVEAEYDASVATHWLEAHPSVLLQTDGDPDTLSATNFTLKLSLDVPGVAYNLSLCPSQVAGNWSLAVYNPGPASLPVAFNLTVHKVGRCLHNCHGHGSCTDDGVCECEPSWAGGDCSVALNATCQSGSRRGVQRPEQHGTCWQECSCNGTDCSFGEACADFTCEGGFRRQASENTCVQDQCTKDQFSADTRHVCLRNCTCPADGAACLLDPDCTIRIDIQSGRQGVGGGAVFFWMLVSLLLGGAGALAYIHLHGVPPWLPIRERGYLGLGLYNEMSEHNGI